MHNVRNKANKNVASKNDVFKVSVAFKANLKESHFVAQQLRSKSF